MTKLFSVSGIVTDEKNRTKVRFCNDFVGRVKLFTSNKNNKRVDLVELPNSMSKVDAIRFLQTHPKFSSVEDQSLFHDMLTSKEPRVNKTKVVKNKTPNQVSLSSIRARKKNVTVDQVLAATANT